MIDHIDALLVSLAVKLKGGSGTVDIPKRDADDTVAGALYIVYFAAGTMAVIIIIVAGLLYATAGGNPEQIKRAKNAILYSIVGLVVVGLAFSITTFITGRLG